MSYSKSIYIFHRSLRLDDNIGLIEGLKNSEKIIPIFIFTPEQITDKNKYRSINAISFMIQGLHDLDSKLRSMGSKLFLFYGEQDHILELILKADEDIEAVYVNKEYTVYGKQREEKLKYICDMYECNFFSFEDYLLHDVNTILSTSNAFYSVFTPFYNNALNYEVDKPIINKHDNYASNKYKIINQINFETIKKIYDPDDSIIEINQELDIDSIFEGSRKEALKRLKEIKKHKHYTEDRDKLFMNTTKLSPYIKFGIVSMREVYHKIKTLFGKKHYLIRQLYWREFYYNLVYNRPDVLKGNSFKASYDLIKWTTDNKFFNFWKNGTTGYPVIDAGMRELNKSGYMHNRARLITSIFLVKHLLIDWRKGEKYFASKLIDFDPSVNNGNWQFSSGSGADAQPYFRMINPWLQQLKHDPDCEYIKKWIPELEDVPAVDIHAWTEEYKNYDVDYPGPCIVYDYKRLKKKTKALYSKALYSKSK